MSITRGSTSVLGRAPLGLGWLLVFACTPEDPQKGSTEQVNVPVVGGGERIANRPVAMVPAPPPNGDRAFPEGALVRRECGGLGSMDSGLGRVGTSSGYGSGGGGNRVRPSSAPKPRAMPTKQVATGERANTSPADGAPGVVAAAPAEPAPAPAGVLEDAAAGPSGTPSPAPPQAVEQLEGAPVTVAVGDAPPMPEAEAKVVGGTAQAPDADSNKEFRRAADPSGNKDKSQPMASRARSEEAAKPASPPPAAHTRARVGSHGVPVQR